jgi:long-chain fatty acid transport protein
MTLRSFLECGWSSISEELEEGSFVGGSATTDAKSRKMRVGFGKSALVVMASLALFPSVAAGQIGPAVSGVTGSANDATAAFFSPAGITRLDQSQLVVQTALVLTESKFDVDTATESGGNGDNDLSIAGIPGLYYVRPLNERWSLGLSLTVPSGIGFDYGTNWSGRYHVTETTLAFVAGQAVAAYEFTDKLSLAAGPYLMFVASETKAEVNNPGPDDGDVTLDESGADIGFVLGAMYQFTDSTRLGLTYRSELKPDLDGTPTIHNVDPLLRETLAAADLLGTEVKVDFVVPAMLQVGLYTELSDRWSTTGDVTWIDMSEFGITKISVEEDNVSVDSSFQDMWIASTGLKYQYEQDRAVSVGAMYATSAATDGRRTAALPLDRVIGLGVGLDFPFHDRPWHVNLNYFDLGDGDLSENGGPLTGDFSGSFARNWALMLDIQVQF